MSDYIKIENKFIYLFLFILVCSIACGGGDGNKNDVSVGPSLTKHIDSWSELKHWKSLGGIKERREEAVLRIQQCYDCQILDLSGLDLSELPETFGELKNLKNTLTINLEKNKLNSLPNSIYKLDKLSTLNLSKNEFINFPDFVYAFKNCLIDIRNNPISNLTKKKIEFFYNRSIQLGKLSSFILDDFEKNDINSLLAQYFLVKVIQSSPLSSARSDETFDNWAAGVSIDDALNFSHFLLKLSDTADAQSRVGLERLKQRLYYVLLELEEHKDLRPICFNFAKDSLVNCGNNASLGLNRMEHAILNAKAERGEIGPDILAKIVVQQFRLSKIEPVICEKLKHLSPSIQVEAYLAVQLKLRGLWDLLIPEQDMLYPKLSGIKEEELDGINKLLTKAEKGPEFLDFFAHHEAWKLYLERTYPEEFNWYRSSLEKLRAEWAISPEGMPEQQYIEATKRVEIQADKELYELYIRLTKLWHSEFSTSPLEEIL